MTLLQTTFQRAISDSETYVVKALRCVYITNYYYYLYVTNDKIQYRFAIQILMGILHTPRDHICGSKDSILSIPMFSRLIRDAIDLRKLAK